MDIKPITREEMYLAAAAGKDVTLPVPITRKEIFLANLAGMDVKTPEVQTRQERFIKSATVVQNACVIEPLTVTENGKYEAPDGVDGYSPVTVDVAGSGGGADAPNILENLPVSLDFSGGDQTIVAPDGYVVKSAVIEQPENLIPENIAEGVNIAGIIGALAAGGGAKVASGILKATSTDVYTVEHNLGVTPDIVFVATNGSVTNTSSSFSHVVFAVGLSSAFHEATGFYITNVHAIVKNGANSIGHGTTTPIDTSTDWTFINSADETLFRLGCTYHKVSTNTTGYRWLAIGGLT